MVICVVLGFIIGGMIGQRCSRNHRRRNLEREQFEQMRTEVVKVPDTQVYRRYQYPTVNLGDNLKALARSKSQSPMGEEKLQSNPSGSATASINTAETLAMI